MSVDYTRDSSGEPMNTESESPMFAPTPVWERNQKNRRAAARSLFDRNEAAETGMVATGGTVVADDAMAGDAATDAPFASTGPGATRAVERRRGNGIAPAAVVAAVVVLAGLAAAGWYATRSGNGGMAQMTPGAPAGATPATAVTPGANEAAMAQNTAVPPPIATHTTTSTTTATTPSATHETVTHHATIARTSRAGRVHTSVSAAPDEAPVTSPSAAGAGVNTSTVAPPTAGMNQTPSTAVPSAPATAAPPPIASGSSTAPVAPTPPTAASPAPPGDATTTTAPQSPPSSATPQ